MLPHSVATPHIYSQLLLYTCLKMFILCVYVCVLICCISFELKVLHFPPLLSLHILCAASAQPQLRFVTSTPPNPLYRLHILKWQFYLLFIRCDSKLRCSCNVNQRFAFSDMYVSMYVCCVCEAILLISICIFTYIYIYISISIYLCRNAIKAYLLEFFCGKLVWSGLWWRLDHQNSSNLKHELCA